MIRRRYTFGSGVAAMAVTLSLAGCDRPAPPVTTSDGRALPPAAVAAERDSLFALVALNTRLISDISSELARVKDLQRPVSAAVSQESTPPTYGDEVLAKLKSVVERVNSAEQRLAASQRRIRTLAGQSDSASGQLAVMATMVNDLQATLESQRTTVTALTEELTRMREENTLLQGRTVALADTVQQLGSELNTVYYVIGTKDELKQKGVVVEEGTKFLIFGGKSLKPARDLPEGAFTAIDMRLLGAIPMPDSGRTYQIVSRQNLGAADGAVTPDGKIQGRLEIRRPEAFWEPSRYLIIVRG